MNTVGKEKLLIWMLVKVTLLLAIVGSGLSMEQSCRIPTVISGSPSKSSSDLHVVVRGGGIIRERTPRP